MSDSVAGERLEHLRGAGAALLGGVEEGRSGRARHVQPPGRAWRRSDQRSPPVRRALDDAGGAGETALVDGTYAAIMLGESDAGRALLIVFSDGVDTASWLTPRRGARRREALGCRRLCGLDAVAPKPEFLRDADVVHRRPAFEVEKTANLARSSSACSKNSATAIFVSYTPRGVAEGRLAPARGPRERTPGDVKARPGYLAGSQ